MTALPLYHDYHANLEINGYRLDERAGMFVHHEHPSIAYSDGDSVELRLQDTLNHTTNRSVMSDELRSACVDWPTSYHLSSERCNVLRPFADQLSGKRVLEIGAGCGAVTRYLGEIGAQVLALEGSLRRARIAATRCSDLDNVTIVASRLDDWLSQERFDVVLLVGVLEYARRYARLPAGDAIHDMLLAARRTLTPDGILILAIENQLGLKYLAGFNEDHVGQPMYGIEDRYQAGEVVTFGKGELGDRLIRAGFEAQDWWFPYPDYKMPCLMLSDCCANHPHVRNLESLIASTTTRDLQYPETTTFMLERAFRPVIRNQLAGHLANSFLVVASSPGHQTESPQAIALYYSTNRRPEYAKEVRFELNDTGHVLIRQSSLYPDSQISGEDGELRQTVPNTARFLGGTLWHDRLVDIMSAPGWTIEQVAGWYQVWLIAYSAQVGKALEAESTVASRYFDAIPRNLVVGPDGQYEFFDQEWVLEGDMAFRTMAIRAILSSLLSQGVIGAPGPDATDGVLPIIKRVLARSSLDVTEADFQVYVAFENRIQDLVVGKPAFGYDQLQQVRMRICRSDIPQALKDHAIGAERVNWDRFVQAEASLVERDQELVRVSERLRAVEDRLESATSDAIARQAQLDGLVSSWSWRLTMPLRKLTAILRRARAVAKTT